MAPTASRSSSSVAPHARAPRRSDGEGEGAGAAGLAASLAELLAVGDRRGWVVSCYQKLEPADRAGDKYRIKLKNRLRRAAQRLEILGFSRDEREEIARELARIEDWFRDPSHLSGGRGAALFAARGLFRAIHLPYVLKSRVMVDRTPVVGELVALAETGSRLLAAVTDRRTARFFDVGLEHVAELDGVAAPDATRAARFHGERSMGHIHARRGLAPGAGEYRFHNRIREERHRHLAHVADVIDAHLRTAPFDGLVVGGIGADASAILPHLAPGARERVLGVLRLAPRKVSVAEVRERALELLAEAARRAAAAAVADLAARLGAGWATESVDATLGALARGQVRTLIVDGDAELPGYRCSVSGRLTPVPSAGRGEGEPVPVADLLDDAIEEALRQRARVAVVHGAEARRFDRLAAILRFRVPTAR